MKLFAVNKYIYLERRYILQDQSFKLYAKCQQNIKNI